MKVGNGVLLLLKIKNFESKNFKINLIPKSQKKTLYKENKKLYDNITKFLYEYFPDFKRELDKRIKICYK